MGFLSLRALPVLCCGVVIALAQALSVQSKPVEATSVRMWEQLLAGAARLNLPTAFLKVMPPDFVQFEFDDLRTYAAEYHPNEHRMVLNRSLSFNAAGGTLRPLAKMTHKELEILYHELFHAYMDFLVIQTERQEQVTGLPEALLAFARRQQGCRYGEVVITPVVQRMEETESRYLTESESWEALNETWAVFIGWAIWNQLEVQQKDGGSMHQQERQTEQWLLRFERAVLKGELRGYYVPEDPDERRVAQKRFLAKQAQISAQEAVVLMRQVLGFPEKFINKARTRPGLSSFFKYQTPCAISDGR